MLLPSLKQGTTIETFFLLFVKFILNSLFFREVAQRHFSETENAGLKISQLLLPATNHRIPAFSKIKNKYNKSSPLVNENDTSSLGIIGSIGFLFLIMASFMQMSHAKLDDRLKIFSILVLAIVLIATIGGFSVLFSMIVTPIFRSWNRFSIFIGFASIATFCILFEKILKNKMSNFRFYLLCSGTTIFGILDQTPNKIIDLKTTEIKFNQNKNFISQIESSLPISSAVFQYPYAPFPEQNVHLLSYDHLIGFIHSKKLKWNYAGIKGREGDLFYKTLNAEPYRKQFNIIKKLGFQGIYIDRNGYEDQGEKIIHEFTELLGKKPDIVRNDGQIVFFKLDDVLPRNFDNLSPAQIMSEIGYIVEKRVHTKSKKSA